MAKLCDTQEELSTWTTIATGVYATFGDSLPIEGLTEAANETAKTGALTGVLADALNWAGVNEDEFQSSLDKCNTEQERQALITETLNGLYDDAAEKYRTNAEDVIEANRANQRFQDTLATIAGVLEPVITKVKSFAADGLERIANIVVEHQDSIDKFVDAIASFGNFILDNSELIISGLVGIGTGLAVFEVSNPYLLNLNTREQIKINKTLSKGEVIRVNTNYGKKTVFGTIDGEESNYFSFLDLDSTFIQLEVGENEFRWGADSNESNLEVNIMFSPKYLGV